MMARRRGNGIAVALGATALVSVTVAATALRVPLLVSWHVHRLRASPETMADYLPDLPESPRGQALRTFLRDPGGRERLLRLHLERSQWSVEGLKIARRQATPDVRSLLFFQ